MRLVMTVDVDLEESGLDSEEIKRDIFNFTMELLLLGAVDMEIGLTLQAVLSEGVTWIKK